MKKHINDNAANVFLRARRSAGFTLIELLVVLVILTLLAGLVGPKVLDQLGGAKSKTASSAACACRARRP